MAKFQSDAEQKKWDALDGSAKTPFDKLLKGTATDADLAKLGSLTEKYSDLARTIFAEGLVAIEERADYLVQLAQEKRATAGKKELTPEQVDHVYKSSKKRAMKEISPELIETVEATLLDRMSTIEDKVSEAATTSDEHFDKLNTFLGIKPLPGAKPPKITDATDGEKFWKAMDKEEDKEWKEQQGKAEREYERRLLAEDEKNDSLLHRLVTTLTGKGKVEHNNTELFGQDANGQAIPTRAAMLDERTDSVFMKALQQGERTNEDLDNYLRFKKRRDAREGNENNGKRKKSKDDSEWLSKIKRLFGKGHAKARGDSGSWVTTLLEGLGLLLMSPQIVKMVSDKLSEYFSWERLKDMYTKSIDYVKTAGSTIIHGVIDKVKEFLGLKDKERVPVTMTGGAIAWAPGQENKTNADLAKEAKTELPAMQKVRGEIVAKMQGARDRVEAAYRKGEKPNPDDTKILNSLQPSLDSANTRIKQYQGAMANPVSDQIGGTQRSTNPEGTSGLLRANQTPGDLGLKLNPSMPSPSMVYPGAAPKSSLDSTVPSAPTLSSTSPFIGGRNPGSSTYVASAASAPFTPGLSLEQPKPVPSGIGEALATANSTAAPPPINLGSFGMSSGTNDLLHIINMGTLR